MEILAIKGHATRGKEVIELLEMLGGRNFSKLSGHSWGCMYHIDQNDNISIDTGFTHKTFSLDGFLAKFPYKVGDKVIFKGHIEIINRMRWDGETIKYGFFTTRGIGEARVEDLQPYKEQEEIMKEDKTTITFDCNQVDKGVELIIPQGMELFVHDGKVVLIDKKPKYPKTYEECCGILRIPNEERYVDIDVPLHYNSLLKSFTELLICHDAYLEIAGEVNKGNIDYAICNVGGKIISTNIPNSVYNHILAFPTEEMRAAFYENFKDLIESCKEFL